MRVQGNASVRRRFRTMRIYNEMAEVYHIARRYFTMNTFDGVLAILGIMIASFVAGFSEPKIIITTSIAAAVAIGISGFYGAYFTERAERKKRLRELEKKTSLFLKGSQIERAEKFATLELALLNMLSPLIASIVILIPFLVSAPIRTAYYTSFAISFVMLFLLGIFLGKVSKENIIFSGIKMLMAGVACIVILYLIGQI